MKLFIAASVACALAIMPAEARVVPTIPVPAFKVMGADFYGRCTNPPAASGAAVVGVCAAYVAGIADGLADAGQVCLGPRATAERLLPFALNWIRNHRANGGYPAALQIKTGLVRTFPCHPIASSEPQEQPPSLLQAIELGANFVRLWKDANTILAFVGAP
jgi:Rap1a immunity proteins